MSDLETIADARIRAAVDRQLEALDVALLKMKSEMNARGVLHSSMTVQRTRDICVDLIDRVSQEIQEQFLVVLNEKLWPTDELAARLLLIANEHLKRVTTRALAEVKGASRNLLNQEMIEPLIQSVSAAQNRAIVDISLCLDGHKLARINRSIKQVITGIPKLLARFLKPH